MTNTRLTVAVLFSGWLLLLCPARLTPQVPQNTDIAIVVHPKTPINSLTLDEVREICRGDRQYWSSDTPIVLLIRAPVARERDAMLKLIFHMTEAGFRQYWITKIFRSEAVSAPKIVYSNDMTNQLVAVIPGAIGFIDVREVGPGVKVLRVDGRLPGEPSYPLR